MDTLELTCEVRPASFAPYRVTVKTIVLGITLDLHGFGATPWDALCHSLESLKNLNTNYGEQL